MADALINAITREGASGEFHFILTFICYHCHNFKTRIRFDMDSGVHCAFGDCRHAASKLVASREFQSTVFRCQRDPRGFNQGNRFFPFRQTQRLLAAVRRW